MVTATVLNIPLPSPTRSSIRDSVDYTKDLQENGRTLVDELSTQGYHLLIEGTLRTTQVPRQTAQLLVSKGYQVSLAVIGTKTRTLYLSTLIRYEELYARSESGQSNTKRTP